jgi:fructose-1,6-bisphosphatase/inositol monophosphatase family enzyme
VTPDDLLELFLDTADAVAVAVATIDRDVMRHRTDRPGQYALDLVADAAACAVLERAPVRIVSEESGVRGALDASISVVLDPVDGSTNCARGIAYWATSLAAVVGDDVVCALVANHATGSRTTAVRDAGAFRDGVRLRASTTTRVEESVISVAALPERALGWKQYRAFACAALSLCDVAAGGLDGHVDTGWSLYPWDYLGGYLACLEAGATVLEAHGEPLVTTDPTVRRRIVAAGTPELAGILQRAVS